MQLKSIVLHIGLWILPAVAIAQKEIKQDEVARIVKALSADDMQGRQIFTEGIEKASAFILNEFQKIGLDPMEGYEGYEQKFVVFSSIIDEASVRINGIKIDQTHALIQSEQSEILWDSPEDIKLINIKKEDDFRKRHTEISSEKGNHLVLVDPEHKEIFDKYRSYYSGPKILIEGNEKEHSNIFILSNVVSVSELEAHVLFQREEKVLKNIIGVIPGKAKRKDYVVFSAHYDHLGILPAVEGDSLANGADDNASGTTAVISLARYFANRPQPERTLVFVAFTAEEIGLVGSTYFSQRIDPASIVALINIEMIGTPSKFGANTAFLTGFDRSNLGTILQKNLQNSKFSIHPDPYPDFNLFYRSDNAALARVGVPAHTISSSQIDQDENYHTVNDEFENLNLSHLTTMIRGIAESVTSIINGKETPTRIDPSTVR